MLLVINTADLPGNPCWFSKLILQGYKKLAESGESAN